MKSYYRLYATCQFIFLFFFHLFHIYQFIYSTTPCTHGRQDVHANCKYENILRMKKRVVCVLRTTHDESTATFADVVLIFTRVRMQKPITRGKTETKIFKFLQNAIHETINQTLSQTFCKIIMFAREKNPVRLLTRSQVVCEKQFGWCFRFLNPEQGPITYCPPGGLLDLAATCCRN